MECQAAFIHTINFIHSITRLVIVLFWKTCIMVKSQEGYV